MELQCHYCYSGRAVLNSGDWIGDTCGVVLEAPVEYTLSQPYLNKIADAESDTPQKYSKYRKIDTTKEKKEVPSIDHYAVRIRNEQKSIIKFAIDNIATKLDMNPERVLNSFESHLKKLAINDILRTDNIITNKGHLREARVVGSRFYF